MQRPGVADEIGNAMPSTRPPIDSLERGPVWVVDAVRGHRECVAGHATLATYGDESVLVLHDEQSLVAVIAVRDVLGYGTVPEHDATIVYVFTGVWD
jgi:hypothetical protein